MTMTIQFEYELFCLLLIRSAKIVLERYLNSTPMSVNYASVTTTLVRQRQIKRRDAYSLYCTLTPTCSPHLSPGLLISIICQGYLEDRKQDISRENVMPTSPFRAAAVLFDPIIFFYFFLLFQGEKCQWDFRSRLIIYASCHNCCYGRMNEDSNCWLILAAELWLYFKHGFFGRPIRTLYQLPFIGLIRKKWFLDPQQTDNNVMEG